MFVAAAGSAPRFTLDAWQVLWRARWRSRSAAGGPPCALQRPPRRPGRAAGARRPADTPSARPPRWCRWSRCGLRCRVPVVDRFSVWREGAYAIWLDPAGAAGAVGPGRPRRAGLDARPTPRNRLPPGLSGAGGGVAGGVGAGAGHNGGLGWAPRFFDNRVRQRESLASWMVRRCRFQESLAGTCRNSYYKAT